MINYFFEEIDKVEIHSKTSEWLKNLIQTENKKLGEINYIFCDDDYLLKVNQDYLDHDYYTDIITFDYVNEPGIHIAEKFKNPALEDLQLVTLSKSDFDKSLQRQVVGVGKESAMMNMNELFA